MAGTGSRSKPHQYAARRRLNGALLGVWVAAERTCRHPDFQFDAYGAIRSAVADLLNVLPGEEEDGNGWRRAFWLYSPDPLLSGETQAIGYRCMARKEFGGRAKISRVGPEIALTPLLSASSPECVWEFKMSHRTRSRSRA